jgi:hypothetical protein
MNKDKEFEMQIAAVPNLLRIAIPAGILSGALTGVVARVAMRIFAIATGEQPGFSIGGTLAVIFVFAVILGIPLAVVYVRFWPAAGVLPGLAYGATLLLVLITIPFLLIPSEEATMRMRLVAIANFLPVPLIYGYALSQVANRLVGSL